MTTLKYIIFAILFFILIMPGCGEKKETTVAEPVVDSSTPVNGDTFIESSISDAIILNPLLSTDNASGDICSLIFNGLVRYAPNYELEGELAKDFSIETNDSVLYINLNPDEEYTAQNLQQAIEKAQSPDSPLNKIQSMTPLQDFYSGLGNCLRLIFNGPLKAQEKEEIQGLLSGIIPEKYLRKINEQVVLTFLLRDNVRWHDGKPFTADDVLFTFEKIMDPDILVSGRGRFILVDQVEKTGAYQVKITYREPFAPAIASWGEAMLPKHILQGRNLNTDDFNRAPIGTGPYRFSDWVPDERIVLDANPDYFEGRPHFDRYMYIIVPDKSIQMIKLMNEEIDHMSLTPDQYDKNAATEEFKSRFHRFNYPDNNGYTYLAYNLDNPLFSDKRVRQALTHAIDRETLIAGVLRGHGHIMSGPFPKASWACNQDIKPWPFDTQRAAQLLTDAGWIINEKDGIREKIIDGKAKKFSFRLTTNNGNEVRKLGCRMISQELKKIGVDARVEFMEWGRFLEEMDTRKFDTVLLGWSLAKDPDQYGIWHSSQVPDLSINKMGNNFINYQNPEIDRLIIEGRTTLDQDKREEIYRRMHQIIHDEQPYSFLYATNTLTAIHNRIHGIKMESTGIWYHFNDWFVPLKLQKYK